MTIYKAVAQLASVSALPRDAVENTLYFSHTGDATGAQLDTLGDDMSNFYLTDSGTQAEPVKLYLAHDRDYGANVCKMIFYKMPAVPGPTGPPVRIRTWQLGSPGTVQNLPEQDAVCLSYHADLTTAIHPNRRRGRIFIGPLNVTTLALSSAATTPQSVLSNFMSDLGKAASHWFGSVPAGHGFVWSQFSQTDWVASPVVGGYVDDRFDTQRRRLQRASGRTAFTV